MKKSDKDDIQKGKLKVRVDKDEEAIEVFHSMTSFEDVVKKRQAKK